MNKPNRCGRALVFLATLTVVGLTGASRARAELVYVSLENSVARFDISSGNGTTIAATKTTVASGLTEAMGLVFGGDGHLYVNNYSSTAGAGTVSKTVLGTGTTTFATGFTSNRGITFSDTAAKFYVSRDGNPGSISAVATNGTVSPFLTFGSNTSPWGVALDAAGNVYSANNASYSISKIVNGVPSTFATFNPGQGVRGVAVASNGNVYSAGDFGVNVTTQLGATTNLASGLGFAFGLAFDASGNVLVADYTGNAINAYNSSGTLLYSFSTGGGSTNRPRYVAFDREGSGFNQIVPEPGPTAMALAVLSGLAGATFIRRRRGRPPASHRCPA